MDRFERLDNTAPVTDVAKNTKPKVEYSTFDLSRKKIGQALPYAIIPIDCIYTVPQTRAFINYDVQITFRNPMVRKSLNGWRVYIHTYYNKMSDLWEGWNNFVTRGRTGKMNLEIPHIATRLKTGTNETKTPFTPMSLYDYLEYAPENYKELNKLTGVQLAGLNENKTGLADYSNIKISALKAMMYQRLWRDKYAPSNLIQENNYVYPENEDHFILSYKAEKVNVIDYEKENDTTTNFTDDINYYTMADKNKKMRLDCLRFRQYMGDRFTTASPFPDMLRGETPTLDIIIPQETLTTTVTSTGSTTVSGNRNVYIKTTQGGEGADSNMVVSNNLPNNTTTNLNLRRAQTVVTEVYPLYTSGKLTGNTTVSGTATLNTTEIKEQITLNALRSLEVFTIFAERMARSDGSYKELIEVQFGKKPRQDDREAIYIGGSYQDIVLNSIYQTSATDGSENLGQQVAQGISAKYNKIGEFFADDYGLIMTVMTIVPDTVYTQGISKLDTSLTMEEQYFPIFNNLSAEPILNKELKVTGNEEIDNGLFGYAERTSEYKSRRSKVVGFSQLNSEQDAYDSALVMARRFDNNPVLNGNFVQGYPTNYSLESFASQDEPPFDFAISQDVMVNYPMPYVTVPQGLGTRA